MPNPYVNKVTANNVTLIDLTTDTAVASDVASGKYFHLATGERVAGTASGGGGDDTDFVNTIMRSGAVTHIPDSVTSIGDYAFRGCSNLALTELPSGVTSIGVYAFYGSNLALTELPSGLTSIGTYAFCFCSNLALTELPSGVTSIDAYTFYGCTNLALTELPSGLTSIDASAFYNCTNLALTELPSGVTSIGAYAFRGCSGLQQLDAQNVDTINANAFNACYSLAELVLRKSGTACTLKNVSAFTNTPMRGYNGMSGTVYVPQALISTYQTATNWSTLYRAGHLTFAAIEGSEYERD